MNVGDLPARQGLVGSKLHYQIQTQQMMLMQTRFLQDQHDGSPERHQQYVQEECAVPHTPL